MSAKRIFPKKRQKPRLPYMLVFAVVAAFTLMAFSSYYASLINAQWFPGLIGAVLAAVLSTVLVRIALLRTKAEAKIIERGALLDAVNRVATILLNIDGENTFETALAESMELLGRCMQADRVHIWRAAGEKGTRYLCNIHEWLSDTGRGKHSISLGGNLDYTDMAGWESVLYKGECIYGTISSMPPETQKFFNKYGMKSIAAIPLFLNNQFWGLFSIDNCRYERTFTDEEISILRSAGLMMINALLRNEMLEQILDEHDKAGALAHWYHSILDAIPLPISVTDANMKWTFINTAVEDFLEKDRRDMIGRPCSNWGAHICNTENCGIAGVKRGVKQTYFTQKDLSFKVDVETLKDMNGETAGFIEIVQDITDVEKMAKKQAEIVAANIAKSAFLATVSHEIRTPMNSILGIAEIQLQNKNHPSETEEALGKIYESGNLLLNIINDILDLSKIEAGKLDLIPVKYDIPSLINDTAQLIRLRYESKPLEFKLDVKENTPLNLFGDELRIKQILNNVLSNAFKYTDKGYVEMAVSAEPAQDDDVTLVFRVSDSGQGMSDEQLSKLFDKYTRFNTEANRTTVGTGLGMSITKWLVDLMNGEISVESAVGKGSVFTVRIPQKRVDTAVCDSEQIEKLRSFRFHSTSMARRSQIMREYMPYGSVLVVDDVESNIYVTKGMLIPYGLQIDTASSGFEAIEKVRNGGEYDIIFMDHMMPKMDGMEATKIIREMGYNKTIVTLTANALVGQAGMYLENGFDGYISKPIDSRELNALLNDFIRNKQPPEVVEEARRKQSLDIKDTPAVEKNTVHTSEVESFFLRDAKKAVETLSIINEKWQNSTPLGEPNGASIGDEDLQTYIITVHGIKSALANIRELELFADAFNLEKAGKARNAAVITDETPAFIDALQSLITRLELAASASTVRRDVETEAEIPMEDKAFIREKLDDIITACGALDKKAVKAALNALKEKAWTQKINIFLDEISVCLLHSDFEKIASLAGNVVI